MMETAPAYAMGNGTATAQRHGNGGCGGGKHGSSAAAVGSIDGTRTVASEMEIALAAEVAQAMETEAMVKIVMKGQRQQWKRR